MRYLMLMGVVALAAALTGCKSAPIAAYNQEITLAHKALVDGEPEEARQRVLQAKEIADGTDIDTTSAQLLLAETKLKSGKPVEAVGTVQEVLKDNPRNPRANEILGKACIQDGQFARAEEHLRKAKAEYPDDADRQRVEDLLSLARGLVAYGEGDLAVARKYWGSIRDANTRYAVDVAVKTEAK